MPYVITPEMASHIVLARINEPMDGNSVSTLREFAEVIYDSGLVRRRLSVPTLRSILSGKRYPDLQLPFGGGPIDWSTVPVALKGRRPTRTSVAFRLEALEAEVKSLRRDLSAIQLQRSNQ